MPPPAITGARRKDRRLTSGVSMGPPAYEIVFACIQPGPRDASGMRGGSGLFRRLLGGNLGRFVNGFADAEIRAAAADVAVHGGVDIRVGGMRILREQGGGGHHLSGLAVAALRDVDFLPRDLDRVRAVFG